MSLGGADLQLLEQHYYSPITPNHCSAQLSVRGRDWLPVSGNRLEEIYAGKQELDRTGSQQGKSDQLVATCRVTYHPSPRPGAGIFRTATLVASLSPGPSKALPPPRPPGIQWALSPAMAGTTPALREGSPPPPPPAPPRQQQQTNNIRLKLAKRQKGMCPTCKESLISQYGDVLYELEIHHIIPVVSGGTNILKTGST